MKILRMLKTVITVKGLRVLLLGKEVTFTNGISLGVGTGIKKDLSQDKIWLVVDNRGQEGIIPIEQIASVANKVALFDNFSASLAADGDKAFPSLKGLT